MKALKSLLLWILIFVIIGTGLYVSSNRGLLARVPGAEKLLDQETIARIESSLESSGAQLTTLSSRSEEVAAQTQQVLGSFIEAKDDPDAADKTIEQRALEHARYLYCQEVIKEYEQTQP